MSPENTYAALFAERAALARLVVELTRSMSRYVYPGLRLGRNLDLLFVGMPVLIGHGEGRPMSASKIAAYLERVPAARRDQSRRLTRFFHKSQGRLICVSMFLNVAVASSGVR